MYHKIQPEQIKLHAFSSPSGDINFNSGTNYVYANLSRTLSGNFNINGSLFVNGSSIFASDPSNTSTGSNSFIFGGTNNNVSGSRNGLVNSYSSSTLGSGNLGINTRNSNFDTGTSDNTILAGKGVNFDTLITGSTVIKDQRATSLNVDKKQSLIISFESGTFFENGNVSIEDGDLYVSSSSSGLFSGNLHALGTIFENGVPVATTGDLGVLSGALNNRILNTGAYAVAASGALNTRILDTGAYAVAASGELNTRINTSVFTSGEQIISGAKTFHENLNLSQSVVIFGGSGILYDAEAGTEIVPASYDDSVGNRGLIAYSGEFLYLKISDIPNIWVRHSGSINWP